MGLLEDQVRKLKGISRVRWSQVARELRRGPAWKGLAIGESSLATYLGAFDRGENLHLLEKHPRLRVLLAEYLGMAEEDLQVLFSTQGEQGGSKKALFTIWDANTRAINLSQESLPAVFPPEVLDPRAWPVLWRAPNGSGRTLVGEWLEAQGKAFFIEAQSWSEVERKLPRTGKFFIELKSPVGLPFMDSLPRTLEVCIAVDGVPDYQPPSQFEEERQEEKKPEHSWSRVDSPPVEQWLEELVFWIAEWRQSGEAFDPKACLEWLRKDILPSGLIDGFETAVGFVGVYAEYGKPVARGASAHSNSMLELARYFLRMRVKQIPKPDSALDFKRLWPILEHLARQLLVHGEQPWFEARSIEEWHSLVRGGPGASGLFEWLAEPTIQRALKVSPRDIQKAAEQLPPEPFLIIRTLQQLFLLREQQPGLHALRPSWVFIALLEQEAGTLLDRSAEEWGEALLHPEGAQFVIDRLVERCQRGDFKPMRDMLATRNDSSPAWVAALESSFVVLGWTLLRQGDVPEALLSEVFDVQQLLLFESQGMPLPRTLHGKGRQSPVLRRGFWLLAAHALSERRGTSRGVAHPVLDPWAGDAMSEERGQALNQIWNELFEQPWTKEARLSALELYGRLFRRVCVPGKVDSAFQLPEFLLERFQAGELTLKHFQALGSRRALTALLPAYLERRGQPWEPFARALWKAWLASKAPFHEFLNSDRKLGSLMSFIPAEAILDKRLKQWVFGAGVPYDRFGEEQWNAFLRVWRDRGQLDGFDLDPGQPWRHMPEGFIRRALAEGVLGFAYHDEAARRAIWKKAPGAAREGLRECLKRGNGSGALALAQTAPDEEAQGAIAIFGEGLGQPGLPRLETILWLRGLVSMRVPGWREAWKLLTVLAEKLPAAPGAA